MLTPARPNKHIPRIAVIGAGLSGLSCAAKLTSAGFAVDVLEKDTSTGGRTLGHRKGTACDLGAQYFTARDPDFARQAERWIEQGVAAQWRPLIAVVDRLADGVRRAPADNSSVTRLVGTPTMAAPALAMSQDLNITYSFPVSNLVATGRHWQLETTDGVHGRLFDAVLISLPAPQALRLIRPVSPELATIADSVRMRGSWAVTLSYHSAIGLGFDAAFVNEAPLRWVARDSSKPGRANGETWLLHADAEWSEAHRQSGEKKVAQILIDAFTLLDAPQPDRVQTHFWPWADTETPLNRGSHWDRELAIGLCGDWLNGGKVEGAWLSGSKLATAVIEHFQSE